MSELVSLAGLKVRHLGQRVILAGLVSRVADTFFHLQEWTGDGVMPRVMTVFYVLDKGCAGSYCRVTGVLEAVPGSRRDRTAIMQLGFRAELVEIVSEEEAFVPRVVQERSFFDQENLDSLREGSSVELVEVLNREAMREGFRLVHKKSLSEPSIRLRCYLHSQYGKKGELNSGCGFQSALGGASKWVISLGM